VRYDANYRETQSLADGTVVTLRCILPEDRERLARAFQQLSKETRYRRFLADMPVMTEAMARYLTEVDGNDHVAIVATKDSLDLKTEEGVGVARFLRLEGEPDVAEAAVTVIDQHQGKGLGRLLLDALSKAARERNIRTFRASVLAENEPMRKILDEAGGILRRDEGDTIIVDVPLVEPHAHWSDLPIFRVLRAAAEATREAFRGHA
jgi:RimJ/RimL family protein N-acetyltransferase